MAQPVFRATARRISFSISWIEIVAGCIVLLGWTLELTLFKSVVQGWATMRPVTAIAHVASGIALLLLVSPQDGTRTKRLVGYILSCLVALIGLATIVEYWSGADLYFDNLLFRQALASTNVADPGRMAPSTALVFALAGISLLTIEMKVGEKYRLREPFALAALLVGFIGCLGYLYDVRALYTISEYASMAVHTAVLSCLLAIGILAARPNEGLVEVVTNPGHGGAVARRLLPVAVVIPVFFGFLRLLAQQQGWLEIEFGVALLVATTVMVLVAVVLGTARSLNNLEEHLAVAQERDRLLAAIVSSSDDAIVGKSLDGIITSWNRGAEQLYGYSEKEMIGEPISLVFPPERSDELWPILEKIRKGERIEHYETERLKEDGTIVHVSLSISPILNSAGVVTGASVIARDITKVKEEEQKLKHSEERFSKAFYGSPIPITISTEDKGEYIDANEAFLRMMGYALHEIVGHTVIDLKIWVNANDRRAMIEEMSKTGQVRSFSSEFFTKARQKRLVEVSAERIVLNGVQCVLAVTVDVTESRQLEEQFRQAQKMEVVGRLAGGVAHDFNNMLGVIIGYSDLAKEDPENSRLIVERLEQIKIAGYRAAALTRQLLAFSRQQVLQPRVLNLNAVINDLNKMLVRMIGEDISLTFAPDSALNRINADPAQIEQVIMNLVVNARDAMPGAGKIRIETANVEIDPTYAKRHGNMQPGSYVMLSVADTGCGMDATTKSRIFEPFFTTKAQGKGTGLGLSTVHGIVNQSGGQIWVYSEPDHGSTFKIYFPAIAEAAESISRLKPEVAVRGGSETILVVEDEETVRNLIVELLADAGYTVLQAGNPATTVSLTERCQIDLLLTDIVMPGATGVELAEDLRKAQPRVKVLYMSGYAGILVSDPSFLQAEAPILQKPFSRKALLTRVRLVLDDAPQGRAT